MRHGDFHCGLSRRRKKRRENNSQERIKTGKKEKSQGTQFVRNTLNRASKLILYYLKFYCNDIKFICPPGVWYSSCSCSHATVTLRGAYVYLYEYIVTIVSRLYYSDLKCNMTEFSSPVRSY